MALTEAQKVGRRNAELKRALATYRAQVIPRIKDALEADTMQASEHKLRTAATHAFEIANRLESCCSGSTSPHWPGC